MTGTGRMYAGGHNFGERIAALAVANAWQTRARQRKAGQIATVTQLRNSDLLNDPQYPQTWDDYRGQEAAKATIRAAIARAKARNEPVRHILIVDPEPGKGKTALAVLAAREIGGRCWTVSGTPNWQQVRTIILGMHRGDVLYIDEIHRLATGGKAKAEWLLHVLENDALVGPMGVEKAHLGITVIGATTEPAKLPDTLLSRFGPPILLEHYGEDDAAHLVADMALRIFPPHPLPDSDTMHAVLYASDGNPRRIRTLLEALVDTCYEPEGMDLQRVLDRTRITLDGLDWTQQRYLVAILQAAGPMGETQLRSLLREPNLVYVEQRLYAKGFIRYTKQGRMLTGEGIQRAQQLRDEGVEP